VKNERSVQCTDAGTVGLISRKYSNGGDIYERKVISIILLKKIIKNEGNILTSVSQNIVIEEKWYKK
jgi:hypothetical protein